MARQISVFWTDDFSLLVQSFGQTISIFWPDGFSLLARRFQSPGQTNEGMADRENSMESPAPEEMPLVLAYPADGGPREQSPNVVLRALPPSVAVNMSTILVGARVIDWPALMRQLQDEASLQGWTLASKVQKRPSEHPGWGGPCYCTKQGCTQVCPCV